jgi:mannose-1-phosphate guanylyltransferase
VAVPLTAAADALDGPHCAAAIDAAYRSALSISVDYGVFERSGRVECVPCNFEWDDRGSFEAVARHLWPDASGNCGVGARVAIDASDCMSFTADDGLVALLGVDDLVVVHTGRVTLVAPRSRAEDVRRLVAELGPMGLEDFA